VRRIKANCGGKLFQQCMNIGIKRLCPNGFFDGRKNLSDGNLFLRDKFDFNGYKRKNI